MKRTILLLALLLTACNEDSRQSTPVPQPAPSAWTITYSEGTPPSMTKEGNDYTVAIPPAPGSIHYVTNSTPALALGNKIVLTFELKGSGTVIPKPENDQPPATLHLYVQHKGDPMTAMGQFEFYRWWSKAGLVITNTGAYQLTAPLDPSEWTSVYGKAGNDPAAGTYFQQTLSDPAVIGFTLGGRSFWGHGVQSTGGPVTFVLHSYTSQ